MSLNWIVFIFMVSLVVTYWDSWDFWDWMCNTLQHFKLSLLTRATRHYQDTESCKDSSTKGWIICFIYIFPVSTTFARNSICLCHIRHDASGWHFSRNGTRVGRGINAALFRLDRWMWVIGKDYPNYRSMK